MQLQVGDVIHVLHSNAEHPRLCSAAVVGGAQENNWWALLVLFSQSKITWLNDVEWHMRDDCTEDSGQATAVTTEGRTI